MSTHKLHFLLILVTVLLIASCKGDEKKRTEITETPVQEKQITQPQNQNNVVQSQPMELEAVPGQRVSPQVMELKKALPALPPDIFKSLYEKCDYLDIIFEELPFSLSQDNLNGIRALMSYIDYKPPMKLPEGCVPFGRQIYQIAGVVVLEADMYVSANCQYYAFYYNGNTYYNAMLPKGVEFYNGLKNKKFN